MPDDESRAEGFEGGCEVFRPGEDPVLAEVADEFAVFFLEQAGLIVVRGSGEELSARGCQEAERGFVQSARYIPLVVREGAPRGAVGAIGRFGAVGKSGDVDDGIAAPDGEFEDAIEGPVGNGGIVMFDGFDSQAAEEGDD
jgi:hypothetical protein